MRINARAALLAPAILVFVLPAVPAKDPSEALIQTLTGPSSRLEADLRVLTDEIGGRVTGSAGYEKALRWGVDAFRRG